MKKLLIAFIICFGTLILTGCNSDADPEIPSEEKPTVDYKKSLKILTIGNSFSDDAMTYLYPIAKAFGCEEVILGNLYIGGCNLETHVRNAASNAKAYTYRKNNNKGSFVSTDKTTLLTGVKDEEWDFITLQQASGSSGMIDTYNEMLEGLLLYVKDNKTNANAKIGWHMTWAYQQNSNHAEFSKYNKNQMTMYNQIVNCVKESVVKNPEFDFVVPAGTSIQNVRTSYFGDRFTADGYHLNDTGKFVIGLTWISKLLGVDMEYLDVTKIPAQFKECVSIYKEAAKNAITKPFEVTNSAFTTLPAEGEDEIIDLTKFNEFDWQPVTGFWNSTDAVNFANILHQNDDFTKKFLSSRVRFTKEQIPVGSILIVKDGWQYRADAWIDGSIKQASRPSNITTKQIVIDEAWWGDYTLRAFNLSTTSNIDISNKVDEAKLAFKIYIPKK